MNNNTQTLSLETIESPILQKFKLFLLKFSSENTRSSYQRSFEDFLDYWQQLKLPIFDLKQIQRSHLDIWNRILEAKYAPSTVVAKLSTIISFLKFCYENDWIEENVGERIRLQKINRSKGKTEAFSESNLKIILRKLKRDFEDAPQPYIQASDTRAWLRYNLFITMTTIGMRVSEIINLRVKDFDSTGELHRLKMVLKGGEEHSVVIPSELSELLKNYIYYFRKDALLDEPLFVLTPHTSKYLNRKYITRMIRNIAYECGIKKRVSSHTCRATVASLLHKSAVPVGEIRELLGHKSLMTTMMYVRKTDEERESAAIKNPIFKILNQNHE